MNALDTDRLIELTLDTPGHHKVVCKPCGVIITQCRCSAPTKFIVYALCDACEKLHQDQIDEERKV